MPRCEHNTVEDVVYLCANCDARAGCLICREEWHDIEECFRTRKRTGHSSTTGRPAAKPIANNAREVTLPKAGVEAALIETVKTKAVRYAHDVPQRVVTEVEWDTALSGLASLQTRIISQKVLEERGIEVDMEGFPQPEQTLSTGGVYDRLAVIEYLKAID